MRWCQLFYRWHTNSTINKLWLELAKNRTHILFGLISCVQRADRANVQARRTCTRTTRLRDSQKSIKIDTKRIDPQKDAVFSIATRYLLIIHTCWYIEKLWPVKIIVYVGEMSRENERKHYCRRDVICCEQLGYKKIFLKKRAYAMPCDMYISVKTFNVYIWNENKKISKNSLSGDTQIIRTSTWVHVHFHKVENNISVFFFLLLTEQINEKKFVFSAYNNLNTHHRTQWYTAFSARIEISGNTIRIIGSTHLSIAVRGMKHNFVYVRRRCT